MQQRMSRYEQVRSIRKISISSFVFFHAGSAPPDSAVYPAFKGIGFQLFGDSPALKIQTSVKSRNPWLQSVGKATVP